jgi:exopolysaccharide biosynthesis polyprenyl glycosylphosphotransferase
MIRVFNLYVPSSKLLLVVGDALLLATGCFLLFRPLAPANTLADAQLYILVLLAAIVGIWSFYFSDLYEHTTMRSRQTVLVAGLRGLGVSALLLSPLVWLLVGDRRVQDHFIEPALALILILLYTQRRLSDWWQRRMSSGERVLLVGSGTTVQLLAEQLAGKCGLPLKLAGVVLDHSRPLPKDFRFAVVGTVDRLRELARSFRPDRIVISSEIGISTVSADDLLALRRIGIRVQDAGELYESVTGRVPVESVRSNGLAFGAALIPTAMTRSIHRVASFLSAVILAILVAPIGLLVAIAVKLESKGPVFYTQERVGLSGRTFRVIKFRSMRQDAESDSGPVWATTKDSRVTRVGAFLRKVRLDELPQVINVLRGEMYLVGPRPERPHFVRMLEEQITYYDLRHCIPPGITGWAQVCANYGSNVEESRTKLEYDLFYVKNASLLFDLLILFKTIKIVLCGRGAR